MSSVEQTETDSNHEETIIKGFDQHDEEELSALLDKEKLVSTKRQIDGTESDNVSNENKTLASVLLASRQKAKVDVSNLPALPPQAPKSPAKVPCSTVKREQGSEDIEIEKGEGDCKEDNNSNLVTKQISKISKQSQRKIESECSVDDIHEGQHQSIESRNHKCEAGEVKENYSRVADVASKDSEEVKDESEEEGDISTAARKKRAKQAGVEYTPAKKKKKKKKKKISGKKRPNPIYVNLEQCKYQSVADCAEGQGWALCEDDDGIDWNVYWTDTSVSSQRVMRLEKHQKINHFPGMRAITHKVPLAKNMMRMVREFPNEYNHVPKSWALPSEKKLFRKKFSTKTGQAFSKKTYILKPDHSCQGKGIVMCRTWDQVNAALAAAGPGETMVAQEYIIDPLLIDGHKFDLRVYVLVLSVDPLRIFLYDDGLVRICAVKYKKPTAKAVREGIDRTAHLTNYAVNKRHEDFEFNNSVEDSGVGNKRTIRWFRSWLKEQGHNSVEAWTRVADLVNRTLLAVQPQLSHTYCTVIPDPENTGFSCFELLGFDVMFRKDLTPVLVEVNHSPSLTCDTPLDRDIKYGVLSEVMKLVKVSAGDRRREEARTAAGAQSRLYASSRPNAESNEREQILRDSAAATRMTKRRSYERRVSKNFHLIMPTDEAVAWAARKDMQFTDREESVNIDDTVKKKTPSILPNASILTSGSDKKREARIAAIEAANDYHDRVRTREIECCLDACLIKTLGQPYPAFRSAAKFAFSEKTLGSSPQRRGADRAFWSSQVARSADSRGKPSVHGTQLSYRTSSEYSGEREVNSGSNGCRSGIPHYTQNTFDHKMEILHSLNLVDEARRSRSAGSRLPNNLHRNSVLHNSKNAQGRSILIRSGSRDSGDAKVGDFQAYMEKIRRTSEAEKKHRAWVERQIHLKEGQSRVVKVINGGQRQGNVNPANMSLIRKAKQPSLVKKGLPSVVRPASSGSMGIRRRGNIDKCRIIIPSKFKTKKKSASTRLRLVGTSHSMTASTPQSNLNYSQGGKDGKKSVKQGSQVKATKKKKLKKAGTKKGKGRVDLLRKSKTVNKGGKLTVSSLFSRVH